MSCNLVEAVARGICQSKDLNPDCLYQHNFEGDWPTDDRREYADPFTGEPRVQLFHYAWRHSTAAAQAALAAIKASGFAVVPVEQLEQALKAPMIDHSGRKTGVYDLIRATIAAAGDTP
jgi:hypothetical protein